MPTKIEIGIAELRSSEKIHRELAKEMFNAYNKAMYSLDFLAAAVFNRSISLISGFCDHIENKNFICAVPLIRLQVDNLLRFYASYIVGDPHKFASEVLSGKQINRLKDKNGEKMTDRHLVNCLSNEFPWIKKLYEETSGYVHLSSKHIFNAIRLKNKKSSTIEIFIGKEDQFIPDSLREEAIEAMIAVTKALLKFLHGWVYTKDNPEKIDEYKKQLTNG